MLGTGLSISFLILEKWRVVSALQVRYLQSEREGKVRVDQLQRVDEVSSCDASAISCLSFQGSDQARTWCLIAK